MACEVTIVRVYIHEGDHGRRKSLMNEIMELLHDRQRVKGLNVFRGIAGFDETGEIHAADMLRINVHLPLVIEFFDAPQAAEAAMQLLHGLVPDEHVVHWPAQCRGDC
jgi:PII-like signaling protein